MFSEFLFVWKWDFALCHVHSFRKLAGSESSTEHALNQSFLHGIDANSTIDLKRGLWNSRNLCPSNELLLQVQTLVIFDPWMYSLINISTLVYCSRIPKNFPFSPSYLLPDYAFRTVIY